MNREESDTIHTVGSWAMTHLRKAIEQPDEYTPSAIVNYLDIVERAIRIIDHG